MPSRCLPRDVTRIGQCRFYPSYDPGVFVLVEYELFKMMIQSYSLTDYIWMQVLKCLLCMYRING